jgi:hypothetical protein
MRTGTTRRRDRNRERYLRKGAAGARAIPPGYSVYSYFRTVMHYTIIGYLG